MGKFMPFQGFKNIHLKVKGAERSLESQQQVTAIINILISGINYILAHVRTKQKNDAGTMCYFHFTDEELKPKYFCYLPVSEL